MKKSCFLVSYPGSLLSDGTFVNSSMFELAKSHGFDAVEPLYSHELAGPNGVDGGKKFREKALETGLDVSCLSFATAFLTGDASQAVASLKKAVDVADALGSPFLHHTFEMDISNAPELYNKCHKRFVEVAREAAYYAGEKGIECIYEDQGFYVNTPDRLADILTDIDLPNTGVCLDVGNALFYDILPERWAGMFAKYIKHVHIKDYIRKSIETCPLKRWHTTIEGNCLRGTVIGHGVVNFEKIFSILLSRGYDGYFSLEYEGREDVIESVKESVDNMQLFYDLTKKKLEYAGKI